MTKVAIYARVSTDKQTTDNQLRELRAIADKNGWELINEFIDEGVSGAKGRDKRPRSPNKAGPERIACPDDRIAR